MTATHRTVARAALWLAATVGVFAQFGQLFRPPEPPELTALVTKTRAGLDSFWKDQLLNFKPPPRVRAYRPDDETEPCGPIPEDNAIYCEEDGGVYYDVAYLNGWRTRIGEYAAISTLAHEYGHRVQDHLGLDEAQAGLFTLQKEMMADCLAGAYLGSVNKRTPLSEEALRQITLKLAAVGDRETPWYHPQAHGRPGQRLDAFNEGFDGHSCTAEDFFRALGIDPEAVQLAPPGRGSVRQRIKPRVDRFELRNVRWTPTIPARALESIEATYQSSAKIELKVTLTAFSSAEASGVQLDALLKLLALRGYQETRRSRVSQASGGTDLGTLVVLQGSGEIVVWTNGPVFNAVEGPRDAVWPFVSVFIE